MYNYMLLYLLLIGWVFIEQYGWYILLGIILLIYIWYKLQPKYYAWIKKREKWIDEQNYGKMDRIKECLYLCAIYLFGYLSVHFDKFIVHFVSITYPFLSFLSLH